MTNYPQTGTLDLLVSLSEELPKLDTYFTSVVAKVVETLRNLVNNDPQKLAQHIFVNEQSVDSYLFQGWRWNEGRYNSQRSLQELVSTLNKVRNHKRQISYIYLQIFLNPLGDNIDR